MDKYAKISDTVLHLLNGATKGKRGKICVVMRNDIEVPIAIAGSGHRLVVVGDRFKPLFRFIHKNKQYHPALTVEALFHDLPLQCEAFDAMILTRALPKGCHIAAELQRIKKHLQPGGLLMWVHPTFDGAGGKIKRIFSSKWYRIPRYQLCRIAMEQGFRHIGQEMVQGRLGRKYVLTIVTVP